MNPTAALPGSAQAARPAARATLDLRIAGMYCAACAAGVERALESVPGVVRAEVNFAGARARVTREVGHAPLSALLEAVARAGYAASEDAPDAARALREAEERRMLWRLLVALFCGMQVMMYQAPSYFAAAGDLAPDTRSLLLRAAWLLSLPVVLFSSGPFFAGAWTGLRQGRVTMDLPVALGIAVAFAAGTVSTFDPGSPLDGAYLDSLTMFVAFVLGGRWLSLRLRGRAAQALEDSISRAPETARRQREDGAFEVVSRGALRSGDRVRVLPGESFPGDGPVLEGETEADEALLTGESLPVAKGGGALALAGSVNLRAAVLQRLDAVGTDTRHAGIVQLVQRALGERPSFLGAADRLAAPFLGGVILLAAGAAAYWAGSDPGRAVATAVAVLLVTCPCAVSLAGPAAFVTAAGALSRRGILVQRLDAIEALAHVDTVCLDKTGTLTERQSRLAEVELLPAARTAGLDAAGVLALAGSIAALSSHPLSAALVLAASHDAPPAPGPAWLRSSEQPGRGVEVESAAGRYRLGAPSWLGLEGAAEGVALVGPEGALARFRFEESLRAGAAAAVRSLRADGLSLKLLSGDAEGRVHTLAAALGIADARGAALPDDKLAAVAALQAAGHRVAMVGDGINDAPVLARADVSVALGDGAALARIGADIVLLSGSLADLVAARVMARRVLRIVRQNLAWAVAYNAVCVPLALAGLFPPWAAAAGMAASSLLVILNALRLDRREPAVRFPGASA